MSTFLGLFAIASMAAAVHAGEISIPISTTVSAPPGSQTVLASIRVDDEFVGEDCVVYAESENQNSVHPGNDLVVASGLSSVTVPNVEGVTRGVVVAEESLLLGSQVVVTLIMGSDGSFSAGMHLVVDCLSDVPPPTIPPVTTTAPDEIEPTIITTTTIIDEVLPTVLTTTTVPDEVVPTEALPSTLPLTGPDSGSLGLVALALAGPAVLFLVATRARRED